MAAGRLGKILATALPSGRIIMLMQGALQSRAPAQWPVPSSKKVLMEVKSQLLTTMKERVSPIWESATIRFESSMQWLKPRQQSAFILAGIIIVLLLLIYGGVAAAVAAVAAWIALMRHFAQTDADRQRRITESFSKALEQLVHDKTAVRLGGIYLLERISRESQDDYWTVMETLCAFVREAMASGEGRPTADVATILTVIGRRHKMSQQRENDEQWRFDFRGVSLCGADLRRMNLEGANLSGADLSQADLRDANLSRACFEGTKLHGANLVRAKLQEACFNKADLSHADLGDAEVREADFSEANLSEIAISGLVSVDPPGEILWGADFSGVNLQRVNLSGAKLFAVNLNSADLLEANLHGASLRSVDLRLATLSEADLREADLSDANLSGADLTSADLRGARLSRANLDDGADLGNANLHAAKLDGANLSRSGLDGTNLSDTDCRGARFLEADLSMALLSGADFRGADLSRATGLSEEQLAETNGDARTQLPDGMLHPPHWPDSHIRV